MKYLAFTFLLTISIQFLAGQNLAKKAYSSVVNTGPSTGPEFIVLSIVNLNTNEPKEMILSINKLFDCLALELNNNDYKNIKKYLLTKSSNRTIDLRNLEALKIINFYGYKSKESFTLEKKIDEVIEQNHLIDSLSEIDSVEGRKSALFDEYYMLRRRITKQIADSISAIRPINKKEKQVLNSLHDIYCGHDENGYGVLRDDTKEDRISRERIIRIWDSKISLYQTYKKNYIDVENELMRLEKKFFRAYYNKYGITFCKALFRYGAICYFGDENPIVEFGGVVK